MLSSKQQAASSKQQATSSKQQAASSKQQAASSKQQAASSNQAIKQSSSKSCRQQAASSIIGSTCLGRHQRRQDQRQQQQAGVGGSQGRLHLELKVNRAAASGKQQAPRSRHKATGSKLQAALSAALAWDGTSGDKISDNNSRLAWGGRKVACT